MKPGYLLAPLVLAMAVVLPITDAGAQPYPPPPPGPPSHTSANVSYGYATVISVNPAYDTSGDVQCDDAGYQRVPNDTTGSTIAGAIIGGAIGNAVGRRGDRGATTAVGVVAGAAIGNSVAQNNNAGYYQQGACHPVDGQGQGHQIGFNVEYSYKGDVYVALMPYDPGNQVRVRVSVVPAEDNGPPPPRN